MSIPINQPGHVPQCKDHAEIQTKAGAFQINPASGAIEYQEWDTPWLEGCPHQREGGNAVKWQWQCQECRWNNKGESD